MTDKYILGGDDGRTPIPVDDLLEWARWMEFGNRQVASDRIGHLLVSTVFLGFDHNFRRLFNAKEKPILFETMVFSIHEDRHNGDQYRYFTWDEAVAQHEQIVTRLKRELSG